MNNLSNAYSFTPNQLDVSGIYYEKFPQPNINNISFIKKISLNEENRFFGSLDIREEFMNHQPLYDPIASIR